MRQILVVLAFCAALPSAAQVLLPSPPMERPAIFQELRQHLTLTDAQMQSLMQIQEQRSNAERAIYEQIRERQTQLQELLRNGTNDTGTVGRLMVEINNLQRQLPLPGGPYRTQALAVLTDAQKARLPGLEEALRLNIPANQAASLNLIDRPQMQVQPRPLPMPMPMPNASDAPASDPQ